MILQQIIATVASWGSPPEITSVGTIVLTDPMRAILAAILTDEDPPPWVVPTSEGGIQLEWHRAGIDLEIELWPSGRAEGFIEDRVGKWLDEGVVEHADLRALIARLTP